MTAAGASLRRLKDWFVQDALPFWVERAFDDEKGGFYESLDFNGDPVTNQPRRVRVQARQIHTFTQAGLQRWSKDAEALAAKGFDYFLRHACPDGGLRGCVHTLSGDGAVLDKKRDLYDQAFLLLACASRWDAAKDERALTLAHSTIAFLDRELSSPHGGWLESDKGELPRRQNPHMHLLEAFMALYDATGDDAWLDRAKSVFSLFEKYFFDDESGVLREFFDANLAPAPSEGDRLEPGHMAEWVWLLGRFAERTGAPLPTPMTQLYASAASWGFDDKEFIIDWISLDKSRKADTRRLWPQTEYVKAAITLARQGGQSAENDASAMIDRLFNSYLNENVTGLWCDQFHTDGEKLARDVPASILYHLCDAAIEAARGLETLESR